MIVKPARVQFYDFVICSISGQNSCLFKHWLLDVLKRNRETWLTGIEQGNGRCAHSQELPEDFFSFEFIPTEPWIVFYVMDHLVDMFHLVLYTMSAIQ